MRYIYRCGEREYEVEVASLGDGMHRAVVDGVALELHAEVRGGALELTSDSGTVRAWVSPVKELRFVTAPGVGEVVLEREERRRGRDEHAGELSSPMPGKVVKVLTEVGAAVAKGDTLVIVEAMKTELRITASRDGNVARVHAVEGDMCDAGAILVELTE